MKDFLLENYNFLTKSVEVIAAIVGLITFKKYKSTHVKYFIYFLVYVAVIELIGSYPRYFYNYEFLTPFKLFVKNTWAERNFWWYNIFWNIGSALFYSFYFLRILKFKLYKNIVIFSRALFVVLVLGYIVLNPDKLFDNTVVFNTILGAFLILICTSLFLLEILQSEKILTFYKSLNFYIATIVFIWFLVITPIVFYNIYFSKADWNFIILKWQIYLIMNVFMYLGFALALLVCKPEESD